MKSTIRTYAQNKADHYKYWVYVQMNPELVSSPFLDRIDRVGKAMTKFRLGSHKLSIETKRWSGLEREDRLCVSCNILGDENHVIYECRDIMREDMDLTKPISSIWKSADINKLFERILNNDYI